jgi:uncharacterized protein YndB with AHSA1/START domain
LSWEASHSVITSAEPPAVWALWADPDRWPDWNEQLERVEGESPLELGAELKLKLKRGGKVAYKVVELEPERLLVTEMRLPGARLRHEHRIEGGEITNVFRLSGALSGLYVVMMGRSLKKLVPSLPEREAALAENRL